MLMGGRVSCSVNLFTYPFMPGPQAGQPAFWLRLFVTELAVGGAGSPPAVGCLPECAQRRGPADGVLGGLSARRPTRPASVNACRRAPLPPPSPPARPTCTPTPPRAALIFHRPPSP